LYASQDYFGSINEHDRLAKASVYHGWVIYTAGRGAGGIHAAND